MNEDVLKRPPIRLEQREYQDVCERVLRRDGWRCQFCGSMTDLEVHHQEFRSHSGDDDENNLITLCNRCHWAEHGPK
jgi:5-methylcytosine-specific restriction endonuclease McrA